MQPAQAGRARRLAPRGTRSPGFWLIVALATANYTVLSASAPLVSRSVSDLLGGDESVSGLLVSITGLVGAACMVAAGVLVGRAGARRVTLGAAATAAIGLAVIVASFDLGGIAVSRLLYGAGNAGITVATTAWVSASTPEHERGRALGYYGISVWLGLALGPVLGENVYASQGNTVVWATLLAVQALTLVLALALADQRPAPSPPRPAEAQLATSGRARAKTLTRVVAAPATVAISAWGAQGLFTAFLVRHLESAGLASVGLLGAANVFLVFAASVVAARLLAGSLPDRLRPARLVAGALVVVALGLAMLAVSPSFWAAALSAVVLGIGYSPLYPALTLLSTSALPEPLRAGAIGAFSASTSVGMAIGALAGGALIAAWGSVAALLVAAGVQLAVLPVLRFADDGR